jgi:predicted Rossmann fold flavoprotein
MASIEQADIVIVGAGAAGLMAAIWAGRTCPGKSIVLLDGAAKLGAKILVAGGGRCNVTHYAVDPARYAGSSTSAIAKVLKRFDVPETVAFFRELGVELKREDTGKLFPTTDRAQDVLHALFRAVRSARVDLRHPRRVEQVTRTEGGFEVAGAWGRIRCRRLVLATGGRSLPKSGSDGKGYEFAAALGHQVTRTFPALVPLTLSQEDPIRELSGITLPATIRLHASTGKRLAEFTNSTLCTHFGLSGPSVLDISRHLLDALERDPAAYLSINWVPGMEDQQADAALLSLGHRSVRRYLQGRDLPDRLITMLLRLSGLDVETRGDQMPRAERRTLVRNLTDMRLDVTGDRGYKFAEVTAGGVPLAELDLKRMASRVCPNLFLCGEICDVDGPIGGLNFQWAWSSGYVVGQSLGAEDQAGG